MAKRTIDGVTVVEPLPVLTVAADLDIYNTLEVDGQDVVEGFCRRGGKGLQLHAASHKLDNGRVVGLYQIDHQGTCYLPNAAVQADLETLRDEIEDQIAAWRQQYKGLIDQLTPVTPDMLTAVQD